MGTTSGTYRADNLGAVREFCAASVVSKGARATWHPGDVEWMLASAAGRGSFDPSIDMRLWWDESGNIVAMAWFYAPFFVRIDTLPDESLGPSLSWAEEHRRETGGGVLVVRAPDGDAEWQGALDSRGYERIGDEHEMAFEFDLDDSLPTTGLPDGMSVRDGTQVSLEARAACHRDAWSHPVHAGAEETTSTFTRDVYERVRAMPSYDAELDLSIATDAGELAACCIVWPSLKTRVGVFEPMGTRPAFRGQRLAQVLNREGFRRLRDRGHSIATVCATSRNPVAMTTYAKNGFKPTTRFSLHARTI